MVAKKQSMIPESKTIQIKEDRLKWDFKSHKCTEVVMLDDMYDEDARMKLYHRIYHDTMTHPNMAADRIDVIMNGRRLAFNKSNLVLNLIIWTPVFRVGYPIKDSYIVPKKHNESTIDDICFLMDDDLIYRGDIEADDMADNYGDAMGIDGLSALVNDYGPIRGNSFSMYNFMKFLKQYPQARKHTELKYNHTNMSTGEREKDITKNYKSLKRMLVNSWGSLGQWMHYGGCISDGQGEQVFCCVGMVSDMKYDIVPWSIDTNYMNGLKQPYQFLLESYKGRKAILNNDKRLPDSGAFDKNLMFACERDLDLDVECCDTVNFVDVYISDIAVLRMLRWRYLADGTLIDKIHTDWVGKTISIRSPITCANDRGICKKCYGLQWKTTKGYHAGKLGGKAVSAKTSQKILSGKHYSVSKTLDIDLSSLKEYSELIRFDDDSVFYNPVRKCKEIGFNSYEIDGIEDIGSGDTAGGSDSFVSAKLSKLYLIDTNDKQHEINLDIPGANFDITKDLHSFIISNHMKSEHKNGITWIDAKSIKKDFRLFEILPMNSEITKHFDQFLRDIDNNRNIIIAAKNINDYYKLFSDFLLATNITFPSVHFEMILCNMIRKRNQVTSRLDMTKKIHEKDYVILGIRASIKHSENTSSMLMSQSLKTILKSPEAYMKYRAGYNDGYLTHKTAKNDISYLYR